MNIKRYKIYYILILMIFNLLYYPLISYYNIVKEKTAYDILKEKLLINN